MPEKTVKISLRPEKLIFFFLLAAAVVAVVFWAKSDSQKSATEKSEEAEMVVPVETGVADSGFELENSTITALNAKTILDTLEGIDGKQSLKIYFSGAPSASVKIGDYLNNVEGENFYRLSFWSKTNGSEGKNIRVNVGGPDGSQYLGDFSLSASDNAEYYEFNFQAKISASDLVLVSTDGKRADAWLDNVLMEKINVESAEQLQKVRPTAFGDTARFNVDQFQMGGDANSESFFALPNRKMGQIFQLTNPMISGISLKIQKKGTGGTGDYQLQIREFDDRLGIVSSEVIASRKIYTNYPASFLDQIKEKELIMREEFNQNETDIKEGRTPNDPTVDQYPPDFTQQQIDESKAQRRKDRFNLALSEMRENFNVPYELNIPIAAKLDTNQKYWIGIDSEGVRTDKRNFIKVFHSGEVSASQNNSGLVSEQAGVWKEHPPLWFKTFYPKHAEINGKNILSGATISDLGDSLIYRYRFTESDRLSLSGFPGRKIYDIYDSNFEKSDVLGNYELSDGQYAIYKFNTVYGVKKIILRSAKYNQSLAINFSSDGENWQEVFSNDPEEDNQSIAPIVINPDSNENVFYLRMMPAGGLSVLSELELGAELVTP